MRAVLNDETLENMGWRLLTTTPFILLPEPREQVVTVPYRHGAYDFTRVMDSRLLTLHLFCATRSPYEWKSRVAFLNQALCSDTGAPKTATFCWDEWDDRELHVRLCGAMSASYEGGGYRLQVPLKAVQPFYEAREWSSEELGKGYAFTVQGEEVITVSNRGDLAIAPITQFTGQIRSIRLSLNQKEWAIHLPFTVEHIIIDHERMTVTDGNGRNLFSYCRGQFLKLAPGENHLTVTGGDGELHLYVKMKARYWF